MAFCKLNMAFTNAPILQHFQLAVGNIKPTDACGFTIGGDFNQYDGSKIVRPVDFYSRHNPGAKYNYYAYYRVL